MKKAEKTQEKVGAKYIQSASQLWIDSDMPCTLTVMIGNKVVPGGMPLSKLRTKLVQESRGKQSKVVIEQDGNRNIIELYTDTILRNVFYEQCLLLRRGYFDGLSDLLTDEEFKQVVFLAGCVGQFTYFEDKHNYSKVGVITEKALEKHIKECVTHLESLPLDEARKVQEYLHTRGHNYVGLAWQQYIADRSNQLEGRRRPGRVRRKGNLDHKRRLAKAKRNYCEEDYQRIKTAGKRQYRKYKQHKLMSEAVAAAREIYKIKDKYSDSVVAKVLMKGCFPKAAARTHQPPVSHPLPLQRDTKKEKTVSKLLCVLDTEKLHVYRLTSEDALKLVESAEKFKLTDKKTWKQARIEGRSSYKYEFEPEVPEVKETPLKVVKTNYKEKLLADENKEARTFQRLQSDKFKKSMLNAA